MVHSKGSLSKCRKIDLPKVVDERGNLTFIEQNHHVPFDIRRVYYLYDIPGGERRGGHAHIELEQFIIAVSGSFDLILEDQYQRETFHLNRPFYGIYVPPMAWRELANFSSDSVCLVLVSDYYDEDDYIRDYNTFKNRTCEES